MGAQLNIKDAETVRLARDLAGRRGLSVTRVVRDALEREVGREELALNLRADAALARIGGARDRLPPAWRGKSLQEIMDSIYDEDGLPA